LPVDPLAGLAAEPARAALFLDVDGTLAPIVDDPTDAAVPEPTRRELRRLAGRYGLAACVSGRPEEDARAIVGVPELTYVGEHGLGLAPEAAAWAGRIHAFAAESGWPVEEKPLSVAFHYRTAADPDAARAHLEEVEAAAAAQGFRTRWGRMVLEVLPPVEASKGTAVRRLLERTGLRRALFAGDDTTDLDGFAALDGLELAVRVAVASPEGPTRLADEADVVVGSPAELAGLLAQL
jgi:trehalose 6-phosphate phosphatase